MVIAIWGRDGADKSTLSDMLGVLFSKKGICIVIDTDLTQPTIPARVHGAAGEGKKSLGYAVSGAVITDIRPYLHQHPRHKGLFYAGLTDGDDFLSYELGLESDGSARDFIDRCNEQADTVILDLSGQRCDPFLPAALSGAEHIILPIVPDVQGLCWFLSVRPLLESMGAQGRAVPIAAKAQPFHDIGSIEKMGGLSFAAVFPYMRDTAVLRDTGETAATGRHSKPLRQLVSRLTGGGKNA